jgi:hypothetical protein
MTVLLAPTALSDTPSEERPESDTPTVQAEYPDARQGPLGRVGESWMDHSGAPPAGVRLASARSARRRPVLAIATPWRMQDVGTTAAVAVRRPRASVLIAVLLVASCTEIGPKVRVEAGAGKSQAALEQDGAACRADTDMAVQPFANSLNLAVGRSAEQVQADNDRIQGAYDERYGQCMAAKGNHVAGIAPPATPMPRPDDAVGQAQEALELSPPMDAISTSAAQFVGAKVQEFRQACPGEVIAVGVRPAEISSTIVSRLVRLTEPHGGSCFGNHGEVDYLMIRHGEAWETLLEGLLTVAGSRHAGFRDVEIQGVGMCMRTFRWNGRGYAQADERDCQ